MEASSSTVNTPLSAPERSQLGDETTPTTPKPNARFSSQPPKEIPAGDSAPRTPTTRDFAGVAGQRPLPSEPLSSLQTPNRSREEAGILQRDESCRSTKSQRSVDSDDVEMLDGDMDEAAEDEGSDNESVTSDSQRPSKKKKGQRFFCTDFPPCQLSFTRSEHLARHIRKHTGERPFQCHCSRRFSRLDNLRQHAQTVHVNEEIPGDSLAATSTRFQRQIRTDRVRPPTGRSRANTMNSQSGGHSRGHSRNLSNSSIGSTASSMGIPEEPARRRPPPLAMAGDGAKRAIMSVDTFNTVTGSPGPQYAYYNQSPTGYSTPTSTTFSAGPASPGFGSSMTSPSSTITRSSHYNGARHGRRLSVPSGVNPYANASNGPYHPVFFSPMTGSAVPNFSQNSSVFASPTSSVFSHGRRESETELEYRRRTWHSGTHPGYTQRPATSGLMYGQTPDEPRPAISFQPAASQVTRLPGIESFDHAPPAAARPQQSSPMQVDAQPRPRSSHRPSDAGLHQNLTRLDITSQPEGIYQPGYFAQQPTVVPPYYIQPHPTTAAEQQQQPTTPRRAKRQAWYGGPVQASGRPSPEDSGSSDGVPTPLTQQGVEYHPVIVNPSDPYQTHPHHMPHSEQQQKVYYTSASNKPEPTRSDSGFQTYVQVPPPGFQAAQQHTYALQAGHDPRFAQQQAYGRPTHEGQGADMGRLEALVAVATSEERAMEGRR